MLKLSDCPTSISTREAQCLSRWAASRRVVEGGALFGGSTILLAEVAAHVISIDKHSGYTAPTFKRFKSNLLRAGVSSRVATVVGDAPTELKKLKRGAVDFTFLDLTGDYLLTKHALEATSSPLVGVHDMGRVCCMGVEKAILELGYEILEHVDTLVICRKSSGPQSSY